MHLSKYTYISLLTIGLLAYAQALQAQQEFTMYHMPALSQSVYLNPANVPEHKVSITLPGTSVFVGFNNSALSVRSLMDKNGTVDYQKFIDGLSKSRNYLGMGLKTDLLNVRFKAANNFFSINSQVVNDFRFTYPRDLLGILQSGISDGYSLSGLGVHFNSYLEFGAGFTRVKPDSKWTYGARIKRLKGIANIQTKTSEIELTVDQNNLYNMDLTTNMEVNIGAGVDGDVYQTLDDLSNMNLSVNNASDVKQIVKTLNKGMAVDMGGTFQFTQKISFGASLINLGYINWNGFAQNRKINSTIRFDGVTLHNMGFKNNLDSITAQLDSIKAGFSDQFQNGMVTTYNPYRSWLPTQFFLSSHFQLSPRLKTSASLYAEFFNGISVGPVVGMNYRFGRVFNFTASWWAVRKSASNMGLGLIYKPWFGQVYLIMDNVLPASMVKVSDPGLNLNGLYLPYTVKNFNARLGMNIVFGKLREENRLPMMGLTKRNNAVRKYLYKPSYQ
ncbi:MAG: DUF5723 family protein [Cyclobacteriaceae bacterium]|nr:DUF5723 family protein [Cyclobacteriaceae bacterium]